MQRERATDAAGKPRTPEYWNPLAGETQVLWFCGPPVPETVVAYTWTDNGVAQRAPGSLTAVFLWPPSQAGLVLYTGPAPLVTLTPGPHTIQVTYGADKKVATFTWIGSTCSSRTDGAPLGELTIYCRSTP